MMFMITREVRRSAGPRRWGVNYVSLATVGMAHFDHRKPPVRLAHCEEVEGRLNSPADAVFSNLPVLDWGLSVQASCSQS